MSFPEIQIGDDLLDYQMVVSVQVTQELNQHWRCAIACRQTEDQQIPIENYIGKPIEIRTVDGRGIECIHFSGFIQKVNLKYEIQGSYTAQLLAVSSSYLMDVAPRKQNYTGKTLSSIVGTMAGRAGLVADMKADNSKVFNCVQDNETDFFLLNRLIGNHGCWLRANADGIEVAESFQSGSTVEWRGEDGLIDFRIDGELVSTIFNCSQPEYYSSVEWLTGPVQSASKMLQEAGRSVSGMITATGHSRSQTLMAGNTVEIDGNISAKGTYGLIKVEHRWEGRGYTNFFVCTPWKNYCNPQPKKDESDERVIFQEA
ncbi:MAG: contractile injection system protein, VgrG/Pvc8 family [Terracidiphilus sp.]|jgi:hypothetical protein